MKYFSSITIITSILLILNSCKECNPKFYHYAKTSATYFKVFQNNNAWIYYNQDSSKKDSVYIYNYSSANCSDIKDACTYEHECRNFKVHSDYLFQSKEVDGALTNGWGSDKNTTTFYLINSFSSISIFNNSKNDSFYSNQNIPLKKVYNIQINGYFLPEVLIYNNTIWFTPDLGIVKYISNNKQDTFIAHKFYIQ
jgi:hypothetical protein